MWDLTKWTQIQGSTSYSLSAMQKEILLNAYTWRYDLHMRSARLTKAENSETSRDDFGWQAWVGIDEENHPFIADQ
jgi:hypothetical protein